ncbi:hypothetical protein RP20_CCG000281 [Aedes albopictus]|nr:hypothetical protein RP20_CCG000281 [Aedes albopictus]
MASASCIVLLHFLILVNGLDLHTNLPDTIADIIIHFSHSESIFDCWFLDVDQELIGDIASSPRIAHIPKVLARFQTLKLSNIRKPSMVVLNLQKYLSEPVELVLALYNSLLTDHDTKYIILAEFSSVSEVVAIYNLILSKIAWNIVFVHSTFQIALVYNPFKRNVMFSTDMTLDIMFLDMTSDLYGTQIRYSVTGTSPWCALREPRIENGLVEGSVGKWVTETLRYINGSWYGVQLNCNPAVADCTGKYIYDEDGTPFDLLLNTIYLRKILLTTVDLTEPVRLVILAPRGRMLKMFELFTYPFEAELWVLILLLMIACALFTVIFPNLFQNDPFMLPVCGFERYSLCLAPPHEKMILFSLVVLFFFIKCAYENKFISLMTSYPRVRDPESLEDLRRAGVKIAVALNRIATLEHQFPDPEMRSLVEVVTDISVRRKNMAVMAEVQTARVIMHGDDYIDEETGDVECTPLKGYSLNLRVNSIATVPNSPTRSKLRDSERKLFEAGLMQYWFEEMLRQNLEFRRVYDPSKVRQNKDITVSELQPVWLVLAGGWISSVVILIVEIMWQKWSGKKHKLFLF